jgi:hypothetical protein
LFVCLFNGANTYFNNISAISWRSVLLVEETGGSGETTDLPQVTDKLYHIDIEMSTLPRIGRYILIHLCIFSDKLCTTFLSDSMWLHKSDMYGTIKLSIYHINPVNFALQCLYRTRRVGGHLVMSKEYWLCLFQRFSIGYWK